MTTPDGAQLNIDALYKIYPSCFTETAAEDGSIKRVVDFNKLRALLGDYAEENAPESYDFTWVGKRAALREAAAPIKKTLRPCPEESVDWENTQNLYIEGDNLEVLKLLQNSYMGKVKMIYIDPPYNTGNDFVYKDHRSLSGDDYNELISDEEGNRLIKNTYSNGSFHSDWCSMIYTRLLVSRSLLKDEGIIFISIDDNELCNMKKICDEVFNERNFITCITRATGTPTGGGFEGFVNELDYILVYAKNISEVKTFELEMTAEDAKIYDQQDERGRFLTRSLRRTGGEDRREDRPTMFFAMIAPDGSEVYPMGPTGYESRWICSPDTAKKMVEEGLIEWKYNEKSKKWTPYQKFYLENRTKAPGNLWNDVEGNKKATREVRNLFDTKKIFDFPKPVDLIRKIISIGMDKEDIVLDFFSGSCTTAHAILDKNAKDNGTRKFIMVQIPQVTDEETEANKEGYKNICEIGKERIRRAGKQIKEINPHIDTGFRVFKCDESNMKDVYFAPNDYSQNFLSQLEDNIKEDRTDLDLLFDCMLRWGVELSLPLSSKKVGACTIHNVNDGDLVACFDGTITDQVIDAIAEMSPLRVVFRDSSFEEASQKMNLFELFKQKCGWSDYEVRNNVKVI